MISKFFFFSFDLPNKITYQMSKGSKKYESLKKKRKRMGEMKCNLFFSKLHPGKCETRLLFLL